VAGRRTDSFQSCVGLGYFKVNISKKYTIYTKLLKVGHFLSEEGWTSADVLAEKLGLAHSEYTDSVK